MRHLAEILLAFAGHLSTDIQFDDRHLNSVCRLPFESELLTFNLECFILLNTYTQAYRQHGMSVNLRKPL
jgi:hypothetical protein